MCSSPPPDAIATISADMPPFCGEGGGLPAITRSHDIAEEPVVPVPAAPSSGTKRSSSGWKTSKFFSRTMSSGEILRGLKKLSLTSSSGDDPPPPAPRPRKSKSGQQLKKRSSAGNDDDEPKARSPRSPGSFRPLSKAMSVSEPGSTGSRSASSLGIVCRKEDLKAILCTAGKTLASSPSSRRRHPASPLRHTKSASFDTHDARRNNAKEPVRRSGSEEAARSSSLRRAAAPLLLRPPPSAAAAEPKPREAAAVEGRGEDEEVRTREVVVEGGGRREGEGGEDEGTTVKWDECEVVDAVVLGDAIESFLKGKASFRRTRKERSAKSDA